MLLRSGAVCRAVGDAEGRFGTVEGLDCGSDLGDGARVGFHCGFGDGVEARGELRCVSGGEEEVEEGEGMLFVLR